MEKFETPSINLAKNRGEHLSDRILTFALSIGRVAVIITEAIALAAFLYRFGLDRQLVDLHDRINQEQAIVTLLKKNEATYRNVQDRLFLEKSFNATSGDSMKLYQDVSQMIPQDMALITLSLSDTNIHIEGEISSLLSLSAFVNKLKAYPNVQSVSIDKIENKSEQGVISVVLTVYLKTKPVPKQQTTQAGQAAL